jgi:hypothetical protein
MAKPDRVIEKCTVLSVAEGKPWKDKDGKEHKQWDVVLKAGDEVLYGTASKLRDDVKEKAEIERVMVYVNKAGDREYTSFFFPTEERKQSGGGGRSYGASPEELKLKRAEFMGKLIGVNLSYARDIVISLPPDKDGKFDIEAMFGYAREMNTFVINELQQNQLL